MARWFRSEPMEYISLIVNEDAAHDCLADLGKLGVIQFTDVRALDGVYSLIEFCLFVDEVKWLMSIFSTMVVATENLLF